MRHLGLAAAAALGLAGCQAHNDVLVFGTGTVIGADASAAPAQGGAPAVSIGYKRWEGVWMPLKSAPQPVSQGDAAYDETDRELFQSQIADGAKSRKDAYSVFASIGARFNGGATTGEVKAGAGIAQFFATGAAAVSLTQNEALVTVLKVDSDKATESQAKAVAAAAGNPTSRSIDAALGEDELQSIIEGTNKEKALHERRVALVKACATAPDGSYRWADIVEKLDAGRYSAAQKAGLKQVGKDDLEARLTKNPPLAKASVAAGTAAFSCAGE